MVDVPTSAATLRKLNAAAPSRDNNSPARSSNRTRSASSCVLGLGTPQPYPFHNTVTANPPTANLDPKHHRRWPPHPRRQRWPKAPADDVGPKTARQTTLADTRSTTALVPSARWGGLVLCGGTAPVASTGSREGRTVAPCF
ncbi:hypothetical protein Aglo01_07970 [Actinokineospora globicatena]|nr:hypothetical protein Aglo01_07970 [Actinokineospora globicatena]GLW83151.1 hypothetical protein Aglo02_07910 [Actinokineospora globicatena]